MFYRKKPIPVEAVQWLGNQRVMFDFLTGTCSQPMTDNGESFRIDFDNGHCSFGTLVIKCLEGELRASIGDYIIKGVKGEYYPVKKEIFEATYEPVYEPFGETK